MTDSRPPASRWPDVPLDLLGDITGRLQDATDFVRFHAPHTSATPHMFRPWLLRSCKGIITHSVVNIGCRTTSSHRRDCDDVVPAKLPGASSAGNRNMVASADGTAVWLFTLSPQPRLTDILTGAVTRLPPFPDDAEIRLSMENPRGIVYTDGTIFLYSYTPEVKGESPIFTAAIWRPGDATWMFMFTENDSLPRVAQKCLAVAYHDRKVILCAGLSFWFVLSAEDDREDMIMAPWNSVKERFNYARHDSHVLESSGEIMWASILVKHNWQQKLQNRGHAIEDLPPGALLVRVHALEWAKEGDEMQWVPRDGRSLADRVLFLGSPATASFAVDATQLGVAGGCAYFGFGSGVFRYNFIDNDAKLVGRLRSGGGVEGACVWLRPQPTIASIQKIRERLEASNQKKKG
ncbi:hypothetical protein VPH35_085170 [Triticum aestivum]